MTEITRDEFDHLMEDIIYLKNDVNIIKTNTQMSASILSLLHSVDIFEYVFSIANSERLCKALIICKNPTTAKQLCEALGVKQSNIRRDVLNKLLDSLLAVCDSPQKSVTYKRAAYLDTIGFDKKAAEKYPKLKELI